MYDNRGIGRSNRLTTLLAEEDDVAASGRAFITLFLKSQRRILAYILTLLPHHADAEDVLQEVSVTLWEEFDEYDPPDDFVSWGCRIAYHKILHHHRSRKRQRVMFSEEMLERVAETMAEESAALQLEERQQALDRCLEKLARRDQELLAERFKEGATPLSTAERIGRSVDTVYKGMARIRKALYDCVARTLAAEGHP
jgi:RNA polymerase sigma-70 factor (ECF subfamily)